MKSRPGVAVAAALLLAGPASAHAQQAPEAPTVAPAPPPPADAWVARPVAEVQALNKITARAATLTLRVGQSLTFGALSIAVRSCLVRPADQAPDTAMYLDITNPTPGAAQFHGWVIASAPAVSMLEDPVYDIRPATCHA